MSAIQKHQTYFENLDALRFIAACMVINTHLAMFLKIPDTQVWKYLWILFTFDGAGGEMGVSFFFVLSGFLITYLMLDEYERNQSIDIIGFYIRRILRIWPLYFVILFIGFIVYPLFFDTSQDFHERANPIMYILFLANFDIIYADGPTALMLGVLWSISVEEQFYLAFPIVFSFVKKNRVYIWILISVIIMSTLLRITGSHKFHTLTALNDLAIGSLAARICYYNLSYVEASFQRLGRSRVTVIYIIGMLILVLNNQLRQHFYNYHAVDRLIHSIIFAFVIVDQNFSSVSPFKMNAIPWLTHLGKISYGIYMFHMVAILLVLKFSNISPFNFYIQCVAIFGLTIILSELSYIYFESYFLRLKGKFVRVLPG